MAEKFAGNKKSKVKKTFATSSDLRQRIFQKKEKTLASSSDLRQRISKKKDIQNSEVINRIKSSENTVTINIFIINFLFHNCILNFPVEGA